MLVAQSNEGRQPGATEAKKSRSSLPDERTLEISAMDGIEEADVDIKDLPQKVST